MPIIQRIRGYEPQFGADCFLAENAVIVGQVVMGDHCTVWFNAVIRGDVHSITIGNYTNVQDGAVIHATYQKASTTIGDKVSIAHNAIVHGCIVEDEVLIGMGAIIMDDAVIGKGSVIAAGAVVLPGMIVPPGSVYAGVPAKRVKDTSPEMKEVILRTAANYTRYAKWYE
jgi:carbonic anhydrase/acetyltransferase-like protein (isoleucine patch superfamily)